MRGDKEDGTFKTSEGLFWVVYYIEEYGSPGDGWSDPGDPTVVAIDSIWSADGVHNITKHFNARQLQRIEEAVASEVYSNYMNGDYDWFDEPTYH